MAKCKSGAFDPEHGRSAAKHRILADTGQNIVHQLSPMHVVAWHHGIIHCTPVAYTQACCLTSMQSAASDMVHIWQQSVCNHNDACC